ncbi:hypothetical protein TELCIR_05641 [Teladorsagia circumcincta]|uniref:Uncharacterized protein n=1 Tax=Teladorsagia circumcincta TaxID=45464 RepID=A0A2G9USF2_TELCI|nr:hypothetical protein TELCIR_05641 [Teladorsagia circumcincta]
MDTVSHTGYQSKEKVRSKYQASKEYKSKDIKYDPSGHSRSQTGLRSVNQELVQKRRYQKAQNAGKKKKGGKKRDTTTTSSAYKAQIQVRLVYGPSTFVGAPRGRLPCASKFIAFLVERFCGLLSACPHYRVNIRN